MNRVKEGLITAYAVSITAAPIIGANYAVFTEHREGDKFRDVALDAVCGAFCGAAAGVLSPVVALGIPAYVLLKVTSPK